MKQAREFMVVLMDTDGIIREYKLPGFSGQRTTFGRTESNQIAIHSPIVSRSHGYFECCDGVMTVFDCGSTNGLIVNNKKLEKKAENGIISHVISEGDVIRIDAESLNNENGIIMYCTAVNNPGDWKHRVMGQGDIISIGRNGDNDIVLNSVSVSRLHARIMITGNRAEIEDLNSVNGVFVNGVRVQGKMLLGRRDVISIGNTQILVNGDRVFYKSSISGTRISMHNISRTVKVKGRQIRILDNVNITVEPNEFIAIIGGSGTGKSTVMNAMSGYEKADYGAVLVNNTNLYENYHILKNIIGYVPQHDIIYENITLYKMLEYSAKIRMNEDVSKQEMERRIYDTLKMVELTEHKDKYIRSLSGGQKKRASIAVELLADPGLFFLDEPTSGLDPGTEANLMITLDKLSKQNGKTIVMVTHTTQNLHLCDKILFMGKGGKVCFYGTPEDCKKFFGVDNLTEIYNKVLSDGEVESYHQKWKNQYGQSVESVQPQSGPLQKPKKTSMTKQFFILASRYMTLIKNDKQRLLMILLQPLIIIGLLAWVAESDVFSIYDSTKPILFAASCAGIWVGLFNSIQEICKERTILKREYMTNLRLGSYVMSKFVVQFFIAFVQALIITGMFGAFVGMPERGVFTETASFEIFITMLLTIISSAAIGLIVSALSKNSDKAMTYAPFLLIIQLLFSGILFTLEGASEKIAYLTVSSWSVKSLGAISDLNSMEREIPGMEIFEEMFEFSKAHVTECWIAMVIFVVICFVGSWIILRNVANDSR